MSASPSQLPSVLARGRNAAARRIRHWWRLATRGRRRPTTEAARDWLLRHATESGLSPTLGGAVCPGLTAAAIPTLWRLGVDDEPIRWARQLSRLQRNDGSLPDAGLRHASLFNTAHAAQAFALLAAEEALPDAARAHRRACDFLFSRISADGVVRMPDGGGSFERWAPTTVRLAGLAEVADSAEPYQAAARRGAVRRAVDVVLRTTDIASPSSSLHVHLHGIEALLDLERVVPQAGAEARRYLRLAATRQRRDGSLAADVEQSWISTAGLAHLATLWYRVGQREAADRAVACLADRQADDGSWTGSWGRGAAYFPNSPSTWTARHVLDAIPAQVQAAFAAAPANLAEPLADDDGRLRAVFDFVAELADGAELVDVGCGSGRYLSRLNDRVPQLRTTGVDPSDAMLHSLPPTSRRTVGDLLRLPMPTAACDAAVCVEALEHTLLPDRAVAELCRVVRPGGRVLVIDKCREFQDLSRHEPWERWFEPETVSAWLAEHCEDVRCTPLPAGPHQRTPGLFLCWQAVRRRDVSALRRAA